MVYLALEPYVRWRWSKTIMDRGVIGMAGIQQGPNLALTHRTVGPRYLIKYCQKRWKRFDLVPAQSGRHGDMDPARWRHIDRILQAVLGHPAPERPEVLKRACAGDRALQAEVESLLEAHDLQDSFLQAGPAAGLKPLADRLAGGRTGANTDSESSVGATHAGSMPPAVGRYRIIRLIAEGGMGAVYEAEQEQPRRTVALKIIKPGLLRPDLLWRFTQETEVLGHLQHPGIGQIYEAGSVDSEFGPQPWFAMELIRGETLLRYAEAHQLNTDQRLELMAKICDAVQHAHQRGIIHRDLKPGNILIDETGQPKILDFGVARATSSDLHATRQTDIGQLVGTLAYMSPEQVLADPLELDTRSDVYALGLILFELLAGRLPYSLSPKLYEAVQTIREQEPTPLGSVSRTYRGDIETIAGKALEKDKARRYASASDLAADIRRYLADEPVVARPASASYQLQKFVRRHKALIAAGVAVFAVLVAGATVSTWEAARARKAEQTALTESSTSKAVTEFLQHDLLAQASADSQAKPDTKPDPDIKVRTALDRAATRISQKFGKQPLVEASIRQTIGNTYMELGLYREAREQLTRASDMRRRIVGEKHPDTLASMQKLAEIFYLQGQYTQAETILQKVVQGRSETLGSRHLDTLDAMDDLALAYQALNKLAQAEPLSVEVTNTRRRLFGDMHPDTLQSINNLAALYFHQRKYTEAEPLLNRAMELKRQVMGEEHPSTLATMNNLAQVWFAEGKYVQAGQLLTKVLEIQRRVLGDRHPETLATMSSLSVLYTKEGRYSQAEEFSVKAAETDRSVLGEEHPETMKSMFNLAMLYYDQGKYPAAASLLKRVIELRRSTLGEDNDQTLKSMGALAEVYETEGKHAEAESLCIRTLAAQRRVLGEEHPDTVQTMIDLAEIRRNEGNYAQAEPLALKSIEIRRRKTPQDPDMAESLALLADLRLRERRYTEAEHQLRESVNILERLAPQARTWGYYNARSRLGASLAGQNKYQEAEPLLISGFEGMFERRARIAAYNRPELERAGKRIVQLYEDWRKPDKAAEWRKKLARR